MQNHIIIDAHCHAGTGNGLTGPWDTRASLKKHLPRAKKAGITATNIFAAFHSDYAVANAEVASIVNADPDFFFGFAFVHGTRDRGRIFRLVEKAVTEYGFCGIKLHRYDARISREICETARHFGLPVLYDVMGEVSAVELIANEYPDVNFIIPHLSSFADDWKAQVNFIPMLKRYPNVYTDTSGVRHFDLLERAFKTAGPSKILFGSDGPWLHPGVELSKVYALTSDAMALQKMLSGNFLRLTHSVRNREYESKRSKPAVAYRSEEMPSRQYRDPWLVRV